MTVSVTNMESNSLSTFPTTSHQTWKTKSDFVGYAWIPFKALNAEGEYKWVWFRHFYLVGLDLGTLLIVPFKADPELPEYYLYLPKPV